MTTPTAYYYNGYNTKQNINGGSCNPKSKTYQCNEWKNLVCQYNTGTGSCQCIDKYYYWNGTMCTYGQRYGELCIASSQCVPSSAGMQCINAFTGSTSIVCRCSSTQYYDIVTETCLTLKSFNATCRDSTECSGSSTNAMYCGYYKGGAQQRCMCTDGYYPSGTSCVAKLAKGTGCTYTYQCMDHLNQTCTSGTCGCAAGLYYSTTDSTCQPLKYSRDDCSVNGECWSNSCSAPYCN